MSAAKKAKTEPVFPDIPGVEKPLLQALATVCAKLYDDNLYAEFKPKGEINDNAEFKPKGEINDKLDQPFELSKKGGEYTDDACPASTKVISGYDIFNNDTKHSASLAEFGKVIDGFTDFHGEFQPAFPPFAALIVQPKDEPKEEPILILAWRGSTTVFDWINDAACSPTLSTRWSGQTKDIRAHGAFVNLVENTFSLHEDDIVKLIKKYPKVKRAFFTGHSLGGGLANVAHLVVRGQLQKAGSPWAELEGKLAWSACTFAAPQTIVRLYKPGDEPPLVDALDASSYNVVYGCDAVPRLPGMLKYMGDLVEKAVPKVIENTAMEKTFGELPLWAMLRKFVAGKLIDAVDGPLTSAADAGVRFLKDNGIAGIVRNYTFQGTVVYLAPGAVEYVQLAGADIAKTLDINGKAFDELLGDESDWAKNLREAHSKSYNTLMFTGNVK